MNLFDDSSITRGDLSLGAALRRAPIRRGRLPYYVFLFTFIGLPQNSAAWRFAINAGVTASA
jgi:hypothetical protein